MYYSKRDYVELYFNTVNGCELNEELKPYENSFRVLMSKYELFSRYNGDESRKYMENIIRLLTRYKIDDNLINRALVEVIGHENSNLDIFFYTLYSVLLPKEMERISLQEYITSFYYILINNYAHKNEKANLNFILHRMNIDKFKELMLHVDECNKDKLYDPIDFSPKICLLAVIISNIYLNDGNYEMIDRYLEDPDYYLSKLKLNGYIGEHNKHSYEFLSNLWVNKLFYSINDFINDNHEKKIIIK